MHTKNGMFFLIIAHSLWANGSARVLGTAPASNQSDDGPIASLASGFPVCTVAHICGGGSKSAATKTAVNLPNRSISAR